MIFFCELAIVIGFFSTNPDLTLFLAHFHTTATDGNLAGCLRAGLGPVYGLPGVRQ